MHSPIYHLSRTLALIRNEGLPATLNRILIFILQLTHGFFEKRKYSKWIRDRDSESCEKDQRLLNEIQDFLINPKFSVILPTFNPAPEWLIEAIESVKKQIYSRWELCVADDASTDPEVKKILTKYRDSDDRIKVIFRDTNGHISNASNSALELATGQWIVLLDHDDVLHKEALFWVAECINRHPSADIIYSNEDKLDHSGKRVAPHYKPDWNADLFYSQNFLSHMGAYRKEVAFEAGGFRPGFEGAQDYDLALRCLEKINEKNILHIRKILYHWREHKKSTALSLNAKPYAMKSAVSALNEHFHRKNIKAEAEFFGPGFRVKYSNPAHSPKISLIVCPSQNKKKHLENLLSNTTYKNYEIILTQNTDLSTDEKNCIDLLSKTYRIPIKTIVSDDDSISQINAAAQYSDGELIGFIFPHNEFFSPDWLHELMCIAIQPNVGAVGPKLLTDPHTLLHSYISFDKKAGTLKYRDLNRPKSHFGYFGRAQLTQAVPVLPVECMIIKRSTFTHAGGFHPSNGPDFWINFCLRLTQKDYRNIWHPFSEVLSSQPNKTIL